MNDNLFAVKALHKEVSDALKAIATKHGLTIGSDKIRYDDYTRRLAVVFNVAAKAAELKQVEADAYSQTGDPKIGQVVGYRRTTYKVTGYNRRGNLTVSRTVDGAAFTFKRSRLTGKFDYFDGSVAAVGFPNVPVIVTKVGIRGEAEIINDIADVHNQLSPENLSCDGELPKTQVRHKFAVLSKQLRALFGELGREMDELQAYEWLKAHPEKDRATLR